MKCAHCLEQFYAGTILYTYINEATTVYEGTAMCAVHHGVALKKRQLASEPRVGDNDR